VWVNGKRSFRGNLEAGQVLRYDFGARVRPGTRKVVRVRGAGARGSTAVLTLGDTSLSGAGANSASGAVSVEFAP
jgi:hypothetical protein